MPLTIDDIKEGQYYLDEDTIYGNAIVKICSREEAHKYGSFSNDEAWAFYARIIWVAEPAYCAAGEYDGYSEEAIKDFTRINEEDIELYVLANV